MRNYLAEEAKISDQRQLTHVTSLNKKEGRKTSKILSGILIAILASMLLTFNAQSAIPMEPSTTVFVYPENITDPTMTPPKQFTIEVKIQNVTNLYGIDLYFTWNSSLLEYVSHKIKVPVEKNADGILHEPGLLIKDEVNKETGTYWLSYASMYPAKAFNGSGKAFNMTFRVIGIGSCYLDITSSLANSGGMPIGHRVIDGYFDNSYYDVAVIDVKPSTTSASPGQTINIYVTVKNNGTTREETFNVSTYWGQLLIEITPVIKLAPGNVKTLVITWPIPPELDGYEMVWANATIVLRDANPDNNRYENGMLRIAVGVHDIAIKAVIVPKNAIGRGQSMNVTVIVSNQGTLDETVNITLYLDDVMVGAHATPIPPETDDEIDMIIDPPELLDLYVNYTLKAHATPVPGETDTLDNNFTNGLIMIAVPGDVDVDKDVDLYDVVKICSVYGSKKGDPGYDANLDINTDGKIDLYDVVIACSNYGEKA